MLSTAQYVRAWEEQLLPGREVLTLTVQTIRTALDERQ